MALLIEEKDATADAERMLEAATADEGELHAPDLISYEVANALWKRSEQRDVSPKVAARLLADFGRVRLELHPPGSVVGPALGLSLSHGLTAYDAAYLALALALDAPILTLDRGLRRTAVAAGIAVSGP